MFEHLQIDNRFERRLVGAADLTLAPWAAINAWRQPASDDELPPRRVLLFRLERIGDLLMTLGAIGAIRARALPDAELRLVVGSWNAPLAHCMQAVDAVETPGRRAAARGCPANVPDRRCGRLAVHDVGRLAASSGRFDKEWRSALRAGHPDGTPFLRPAARSRRGGFVSGGGGGFLTDVLG